MVCFSHLEEFSTVYCDPHKAFVIVNKAEIDVLLELSCFFNDPRDVGNLISDFKAEEPESYHINPTSEYISRGNHYLEETPVFPSPFKH